jgi:uncharacterized Zn-binding protein involved in type VI secretion
VRQLPIDQGNSMLRAAVYLSSSLFAVSASAGDLTQMMQQPGEWEATVHSSMMPTTTQKACYGGDKSIADLTTKDFKNCSQKSINISGNVATVDATCQMQGIQVSVHGTITPVGNDAVHSESQVRIDGLPAIKGIPNTMSVSVDAHRTGPCKPGEKPM